MSTTEEQLEMIGDCEQRESLLSHWEINFIDSIATQMGKDKTLTEKQDIILTDIWEKVTSNG